MRTRVISSPLPFREYPSSHPGRADPTRSIPKPVTLSERERAKTWNSASVFSKESESPSVAMRRSPPVPRGNRAVRQSAGESRDERE
jgi:hypothetical protein